MIINKILVTFILLITIFLNSCVSVYEKEIITFQNPPQYEYRCSKGLGARCKKVNTNIKIERILKDRYKNKYKNKSEEEIERAIDVYETNAGFIALGIELLAWVGGTIFITITSTGSAGLTYFVVWPFAFTVGASIIGLIFDYRTYCSFKKENDLKYVGNCSNPATEKTIKGLEEDIKRKEEEIRMLEELESY